MNRSADWLHQAKADLAQARLSADAGHHEWACFACHQAVEKALKALHLHHGQQSWEHGLGRSLRDLPPSVSPPFRPRCQIWRIAFGCSMPFTSSPATPISFQKVRRPIFGRLQSQHALSHARALVDAICAALAPP
jgi:hypothetical protein